MTRAQTIAVSLATVLICLLADSTASAQRRSCYIPARPQVRCCPTPGCVPRRYFSVPASARGTYGYYSPATSRSNSYNGSCSGAHVPSYGSNVYSPKMPLVHQQITNRVAVENRLPGAEVDHEIGQLGEAYLTSSDVPRYAEHYGAGVEIIKSRLDAAGKILKMQLQSALESRKRRLQSEAAINEYERCYRGQQILARLARINRQWVPKRLTSSGYNQLTGTISWPLLFEEYDQFAADRARIDALFAQRTAYNSGGMSRNCVEVEKATKRMKATLKGMQREFHGTTYAAAKNFLDSVAYEARFPVQPGPAQVAAR